MDDNPYRPPQAISSVDPARKVFQFTLGRIYLCVHVATIIASAVFSLVDAGELTLNPVAAIPVWGFILLGFPLLFISPLICITMLLRSVFQNRKLAWFALAELLLWLTHLFVLIPTVQ